MVVGGCRSLVAEHWRLKPEALGLIPRCATFLSFYLLFQRSSDSNGPDNLYQSLDLGEPHLSGSLCCDEAQILSKSSSSFSIMGRLVSYSEIFLMLQHIYSTLMGC